MSKELFCFDCNRAANTECKEKHRTELLEGKSRERLSPTMRAAIIYAKKFENKITRHQGGYWARASWEGPRKEHWFSTSTIQALVSRSLADYTQWQEGRAGRFPIEITLTALAEKES